MISNQGEIWIFRWDIWSRKWVKEKSTYLTPKETKKLIRESVKECKSTGAKTLLDIGTGCGIIGTSIGIEIPELEVILIDNNEKHLKFADENANKYIKGRYKICKSNFVDNPDLTEPDVIVANLPYGNKYTMLNSNKKNVLHFGSGFEIGTAPRQNYTDNNSMFSPEGPMGAYEGLFESIQKRGWNKSLIIFETGPMTYATVNKKVPEGYEHEYLRSKNYSISKIWRRKK